jgi:hypothetical protein
VAESGNEGGTWSGVVDGLRKGRIIYVRKPESDEQNANLKLIEKGALPVDMNGNPIDTMIQQIAEPQSKYHTEDTDQIIEKKSKSKKKKKKKKEPMENNDSSQLDLL